MAAKREVWRETLQHKTGGEWETRVLIAYCGSKDISACICICGTDPKSPSYVDETYKLKGAKINHANFQSPTSTSEEAQIPRNEFQLTTSDNVTLEFRLQNGRNCFDWTKLLTILTDFPNMRVPKEPQTPVTFHSKPDPYLYGSDSVWAVYIMHEGVGRRGLVVGVNVVALRNAVRGVSPGVLDIIYPQDPTNKIASWEHGKIKTVGRIGKMVFLEISEECKPGGPGHVWMFVGYGEALGLCETIKNFLHQGDGTPVVIQETQLLPKFDIMHCSFHFDTQNESRPMTTTHTDEHPHPGEESDLPSLELQQQSLYDQIRENCHIKEVVAESTPDMDSSLLYSPRTTKSPGPPLKHLVLEVRDMNGWFHLGVYLGIPRPILDQIHAKHVASLDATEKCKIDMLSTWRENSDNCTWSALVSALHQTGRTGMARRIAAKHGVTDPGQSSQSEDSFRQAFMDIVSNSQQAATILSMQKTIEMEDKKLLETEQHLKEQKRYSQTLEQELKKIRKELHFSERYRGMQLSDIQIHQTRKRDNELQVHTLATRVQNLTELRKERYLTAQRGETLLSPQVESDLQQATEVFYRKREKSDEISQQLSQLYSNQKTAQKEAKELKERIGVLASQCENVAKALEQLQGEKEELTTALKTHEKDMDQKLIGSRQQQEQMPQGYNWIMYEDRRAELRLRDTEIEQCTERLEEKEGLVRMLTDRFEKKSLKLHEMEERIQKLERKTVDTPSAYSSVTELHLAEQMSAALALERLQYKIQLSNEEASRRELQFQTKTLSEGVNEKITILEEMKKNVVPPTKPSEYGKPTLPTRMSYSAEELRDLVPALPNPRDLEIEASSYRNSTATSSPMSQSSYRNFRPPNVSSGHASVTRSTSAPTKENFALIHSGYKRALASSAAVDLHMLHHRQYPQETTLHNIHSRFDDRRAPPRALQPSYHGSHILLPQPNRRVPPYEPRRRGRPGTIV